MDMTNNFNSNKIVSNKLLLGLRSVRREYQFNQLYTPRELFSLVKHIDCSKRLTESNFVSLTSAV